MKQRGMSTAPAGTYALAAKLKGDSSAVDSCLEAARDALGNGAAAVATEYFSSARPLGQHSCAGSVARAAFAEGMMGKAENAFRHFLSLDIPDSFLRTKSCSRSQILFALASLDGPENVSKKASDLTLGFDTALAIDIALDETFVHWTYDGSKLARSLANGVAAIIGERESSALPGAVLVWRLLRTGRVRRLVLTPA